MHHSLTISTLHEKVRQGKRMIANVQKYKTELWYKQAEEIIKIKEIKHAVIV